jgi:hypothetical protein
VSYDANGTAGGGGGNPTCNANPAALGVVHYSGLSAGSHTLVATGQSGKLNIAGLSAYSASRGILPVRCGFPGESAYGIFSMNRVPDTTLRQSPEVATFQFTPTPKLLLWCMGINDLLVASTTSSVEDYWRWSQYMIEGALANNCSVLCMLTNMSRTSQWSLSTNGTGLLYQQALNELAYVYNVASFSYTAAVMSTQTAAWIAAHANQHPDDTGHADIAQKVLALIS